MQQVLVRKITQIRLQIDKSNSLTKEKEGCEVKPSVSEDDVMKEISNNKIASRSVGTSGRKTLIQL